MTIAMELETVDVDAIKVRQKATWEAGDFGQVAKYNTPCAEEFMGRLPLCEGARVLDAACGTGNLAVIAARRGCITEGVDIASNLVQQASDRAHKEDLEIEFVEGDVENLPYIDDSFDSIVSMYGVMFAPRPELVAAELYRVLKPGGFVAMANWTASGFIGKMFDIFKKHLPPPPYGIPSPLLWGDEKSVRSRLRDFTEIQIVRRTAVMRYPFPPEQTVDFFRRYYGPTARAFESLDEYSQAELRRDLVALQTLHNASSSEHVTETRSEYLEVIAIK